MRTGFADQQGQTGTADSSGVRTGLADRQAVKTLRGDSSDVPGDDRAPASPASAWHDLRDAELWARVIRVAREDIAYFKFLFESYEGVALIRTVEKRADGSVVIAILATADFRGETDAILADVARHGSPAFTVAELPAVCTEDWFLSTWVRETGDG